MQHFYDEEVEEYRALEAYAGPFEDICYLGAGFDTTAAESLQGNVDHVDHDAETVDFMRRKGFNALEEEVTGYNPEKKYDLIILSHLPTVEPPVIEPNLTENGKVVCRTKVRARKLDGQRDLELQAVYRETRDEMIERRDFESLEKPELYLFL